MSTEGLMSGKQAKEHSELLLNKEFRAVYRRIMGDTKEKVNIRQAYTILNCSGKNVRSDQLNEQWKYLEEKIGVDRLFDIYKKIADMDYEGVEYERATRTKNMTVSNIMNSLKEGTLVNKQYLEYVLQDFVTEEGFVNIPSLLDVVSQSKDDIVKKLLSPSVQENEVEFKLKVRGCITIEPVIQSIAFTIDIDQPTFCEITLKLAENSDVPQDMFDNDLFLVVYNQKEEFVGLTRHVSEEKTYSTGMMTVNPGDEVMVFGMGTTMKRKTSAVEKAELVGENNKLSKKFQCTLMNIFDSYDVDQDGFLNFEEMNFYTTASEDTKLKKEDWDLYLSNFDHRDGKLTMKGFIQIHEMEAMDQEGNTIQDLWTSLKNLGYDSQLRSSFGCSYDVEVHTSRPIRLIPRLQRVVKEHRSFILENFYRLGEEDTRFEIRPRLFKTDYFGILIAKREERNANETYRIMLTSSEHIKINFPHKIKEDIKFQDSDSEWVLLASYTITDPEAQIDYTLHRVQSKSSSPSLLRA
ncbi:unnamed protein product [Caenorhabditis sp. 36 PRJEB53466]|nr:unnamed protein product [Caenorhabditis sp. 36 PRJEB53466]